MTAPVQFSKLTPIENVAGEDPAETTLLHDMATRAERYIANFDWCPPIAARYLGVGIGGVLALFLYKFERPINDTDEYLWLVEGDLPSAYFVVDQAPDPASALSVYCEMMEDWATAVEAELPLDDVFPIDVPATKQNAEKLRSRVRFIRERILPTP